MILEDGLDNILARHANYRNLIRSSVKAMGLDLFAEDRAASAAVTAVLAPKEIGGNKIRQYMREKFNIVVAGGQQTLDDVIVRIGHLGYVRELDLVAVIAALEITLSKLGAKVNIGAGVEKAQQLIMNQID